MIPFGKAMDLSAIWSERDVGVISHKFNFLATKKGIKLMLAKKITKCLGKGVLPNNTRDSKTAQIFEFLRELHDCTTIF